MKKNNTFYDPLLKGRHLKDKLFKYIAFSSLVFSLLFLAIFLYNITSKGLTAFEQTYIKLEIKYSKETSKNTRKAIDKKYLKLVSRAWLRNIPKQIKQNPNLMGTNKTIWVLADDQVDMYMKGSYFKLKDKDLKLLKTLIKNNKVEKKFNTIFFTQGDSKIPEYSGILSAIIGTILTLLATMIIAFPLGVATAIYLEEFVNQNSKWSQIIEININNLAAIPSILFGLLGLSIFVNFFGLPRSSSLVGGITLALMTLPIIVVSSRAALRSVPEKIKQAGYALGLTKIQVIKDHILPIAFPGITTGSIIGFAQAMGETAPLIIIGMIAFIPDSPKSIMDATTVLPAQIFTWTNMPELAYTERTAAGILILLAILIVLNLITLYLRKKFEVKW